MFQSPTPPKNNRFLWLRVPAFLLAVIAYALLAMHCWQNVQARLPVGDLTSVGLMALALPALLVEVLVYRGYVDRYIRYLDESDAVRRWRQWQPWRQKEDDDIVH